MSSRTAWNNSLWHDMVDDEDPDSDTDSRLSGSVAVDSVIRKLQKGHKLDRPLVTGGRGLSLDPIADHSIEQEDIDGNHIHVHTQRSTFGSTPNGSLLSHHVNGYRPGGQSPSHVRRMGPGVISGSPKHPPRHLGYTGGNSRSVVHVGSRDGNYLYPGRRKDHLLSPVPENFTGRAMNSSSSDVGVGIGVRSWKFGPQSVSLSRGSMHHSMESVPHRHSPTMLTRPPPEGHRSPNSHSSGSSDGLQILHSESNKLPPSGATVSRRSTIGGSPSPSPFQYNQLPPLGPGRSPQLPSRFGHNYHDNQGGFQRQLHDDMLEHQVSSMGHSAPTNTREPNLNDVVDFLSSSDPTHVANAASYLQHLAYSDDNMKAKIRQFGGIPALISQLRTHDDIRVQAPVLGALRNLSYGRANIDNKIQIANDAGLTEMTLLLKTTQHSEIRELVTSVLWNLSSCEEIKLRIIHVCLKDVVEHILIPHSGYSHTHLAAKDFSVRPDVKHWSPEMRNILGALRNISSAGEEARRFLRSSNRLVDCLVWIIRAATGQENTDEKTAESAMCILRNLSYQLEDEVDPQDGADDALDKEWERQLQQEIEDEKENVEEPKRRNFLLLCTRSHTADLRRNVPRLSSPQNLISPDSSLLPVRVHPISGVALLWQPEIVFPYLALLEKYTSTPELMEATAGALQNLTACAWKWSVYIRHIIRKAKGLVLLIELLNHAHDTVVRSSATALRNIAVDHTNKLMIGTYAIQGIIPRLPYGQNSLGISEQTTIALLCTLMELCIGNPDNARSFRESGGLTPMVRLTHSKEHTPKIIFAAHKLCSVLYELKPTKSILKHAGWDIREYQRLATEGTQHFDFERNSFSNTEIRGSHRAPKSKEKKEKRKNHSDPSVVKEMHQERRGSHQLTSASSSFTSVPLPQQPPSMTTPPIIQDANDPGYHMIETSTQHSTSVTNRSHDPPVSIQPISMYAEINDPELELIRKNTENNPPRSNSQAHSHSDSQPHSEPRSSPIDVHTTLSYSTHDGGSSDEEAGGTALYAQVDMEKKRASRRKKEQMKYREEIVIGQPEEVIDSWV